LRPLKVTERLMMLDFMAIPGMNSSQSPKEFQIKWYEICKPGDL